MVMLCDFQELHINFSQYEHPTILTVEEGGNKRLKNVDFPVHTLVMCAFVIF